jgi:hypothetical protein
MVEDSSLSLSSGKNISSLFSECHASLERMRMRIAEASIEFHNENNNDKNDDDDDEKKRREEETVESLESAIGKCSAAIAEIERRISSSSSSSSSLNNNNNSVKTETRQIKRELEEVKKHAESIRRGERRTLIPEPRKELSREERKEAIREESKERGGDQFLYWKKSAKMYLEKAKKKMDSVATKTKTAVKKFANASIGEERGGDNKSSSSERYSDAQRQRERREEEEIRRMRRYGYENRAPQSVVEDDDEEFETNENEDDEEARRKALFATITPTISTTTTTTNTATTTATRGYDINAARNSTLLANRSAVALEDSLKQAERAERAGLDTLENLRRQRETLQRSSAQMQNAKDTVEENRKIVKKMSHWSRLGC